MTIMQKSQIPAKTPFDSKCEKITFYSETL